MSKLHIYAQSHNHSDAWIVGNRESLTALRDALNRIIDPPMFDKAEDLVGVRSFASDGEGYTTLILRVDDYKAWEGFMLPYATINIARVNQDNQHPVEYMRDEDYRRAVRGA